MGAANSLEVRRSYAIPFSPSTPLPDCPPPSLINLNPTMSLNFSFRGPVEDMIRAARCELDLHKSKQTERVAALTKGYTDNPAVRDCRLAQLEGNVLDPAYKEKEKALQDAL